MGENLRRREATVIAGNILRNSSHPTYSALNLRMAMIGLVRILLTFKASLSWLLVEMGTRMLRMSFATFIVVPRRPEIVQM